MENDVFPSSKAVIRSGLETVCCTLLCPSSVSKSQGVCLAMKVRVTCDQTYSSRAPHLLLHEHWVKSALLRETLSLE